MIIISSSKYLFMGNKLLQYAAFIAFSEKHKVPLANPSFLPYSAYFETTADDILCRFPAKSSLIKGRKKTRMRLFSFFHKLGTWLARKKINNNFIDAIDTGWDKECDLGSVEFIKRAKARRFLFVLGWNFRERTDYTAYREVICNHLRPLKTFRDNVEAHMNKHRAADDIITGIHIRQGDYKTFEGGRYYYESGAYAALMKCFQNKFPGKNVKFLVCSNEAQDPEIFSGLNVFFGTNHPVEDMYCLSKCDYILGPPSTYTMWASFVENKPLYMVYDPYKDFVVESFKPYNLCEY